MDKIVIEAIKFGAYKHRHQKRHYDGQEPIPYFNHPIDVMHILGAEAGIDDPNVLAAALLHDTIEDTDTSVEELAMLFGAKITGIVLELSDDQSLPVERRYLSQLEKTPLYSFEAKLVKLGDRIANLRDFFISNLPGATEERRIGHFMQSRKQVDLMAGTNVALEKLFENEYVHAQVLIDAFEKTKST